MTIKKILVLLLVVCGWQSTSNAMLSNMMHKPIKYNGPTSNKKYKKENHYKRSRYNKDGFKGSRSGKRNSGKWQDKLFYQKIHKRDYSDFNDETKYTSHEKIMLFIYALAAGSFFHSLSLLDKDNNNLDQNKQIEFDPTGNSTFLCLPLDELYEITKSPDFSQNDLLQLLKEIDYFISAYLVFMENDLPYDLHDYNRQKKSDVLGDFSIETNKKIIQIYRFLYEHNEYFGEYLHNGFINNEDQEISPLSTSTLEVMINLCDPNNISDELTQSLINLHAHLVSQEKKKIEPFYPVV